MTLSADQLHIVQQQLNYRFRDVSRLVPCFKAAHRSDIDGVAEDGNRTLARTGVKIMELVDKRCSVGTGSRDIAHRGPSWIMSRNVRAAACDYLGFTSLIIPSVRQGNMTPSKRVRSYAIDAIVAAVFEDLCEQKEDVASAVDKIKDILDLLATSSLKKVASSSSELAQSQGNAADFSTQDTMDATSHIDSGIGPIVASYSLGQAGLLEIGSPPVRVIERDTPVFELSEWIDLEAVGDNFQPSPLDSNTAPYGTTLSSRSEIVSSYESYVLLQDSDWPSLEPRSDKQHAAPAIQPTEAHRTEPCIPGPTIARNSHVFTLDEDISRSFGEPYASQLRYVFNYVGSTQSILSFRRALSDLRRREFGDQVVLKGARSDVDHLRIVKRLHENSAADSLLMMCHTVRLFQDDTNDLVRRTGSFVVQTPTSFGKPQRTATGNPLSLNKAAITDRKMELLFPSLVPGSEEYRVQRKYVTRLRQTAAKLALFSNMFGFGILAFLPYTDPFGNGVHLNRLMDITDDRISRCIGILRQSQPGYLAELSAGAEPIMNSIVNGEFWTSSHSRLENLEEGEIITSVDIFGATSDYLSRD